MFKEARESMNSIARTNGRGELCSFVFDSEVNSQEENKDEEQLILTPQPMVIKQELSDGQVFLNLVKMTIMWTQGSFNQFLLSA
jgi:hypothetical protein